MVAAHYKKKTICYTVGLAVRIFPATMRIFTTDIAGARHDMCEVTHGIAEVRHGRGMGTACYV